jgi:hypothetical protein
MDRFREEGITPIAKFDWKHINKLKIYFKANNTVHLVAIAKDLGNLANQLQQTKQPLVLNNYILALV